MASEAGVRRSVPAAQELNEPVVPSVKAVKDEHKNTKVAVGQNDKPEPCSAKLPVVREAESSSSGSSSQANSDSEP